MRCPRCSQLLPAYSSKCPACDLLLSGTISEAAAQPLSDAQREHNTLQFAEPQAHTSPLDMPYPLPLKSGSQPSYPQFTTPGVSISMSSRRHRASASKIVVSVLLVIVLAAGCLYVVFGEGSSHLATSQQAAMQAKLNVVATQLYQQVMKLPFSSQDRLTEPSSSWKVYEAGLHGCAI